MNREELRAGFGGIATKVGALKGDWNRPAPDYEDWTCKDLLAHVTSTALALPLVLRTVNQPADPSGSVFDPDRWNASQIRRRKEASAQDLIAELQRSTAELDGVLAEIDLDGKVHAGPYSGEDVASAMAHMVKHQLEHLADLERLLA